MRFEEYASISRELFRKAQEALAQEDIVQASEKGWGAVAHMVKALAERRGWRHDGHKELFQAVARIVKETGDTRISDLFHIANSLHVNFYEHWMPRELVEGGLKRVQELIERLEKLI